MSLEKAIQHGKEHRKPYYKSGRFDASCRPNGGCGYCYYNRMHKHWVRMMIAQDTLAEVTGIPIRFREIKSQMNLFRE